MTRIIQVSALFASFLFSSCSGGGSKFEGKWQEVKEKKVVTIKKNGEKFDLLPEGSPENAMLFDYDKEQDILTLEREGMRVDIKYMPETKHLIMAPRNKTYGFDPIEMEKTN